MVKTGRGSQFDGAFSNPNKTPGSTHIGTTDYHPLSNDFVGEIHRHIKPAASPGPTRFEAKYNRSLFEAKDLF